MLKEQAALVEAAVAEAQATTEAAREMAALPDIPDFSDYAGELRRQRPSRAGREAKLARRKARCATHGRLPARMARRLAAGSATCCLLYACCFAICVRNSWVDHLHSRHHCTWPCKVSAPSSKTLRCVSRAEKALAKAGDGAADEPAAAAAPVPAGASARASESREGTASASVAGKTTKVPLLGITLAAGCMLVLYPDFNCALYSCSGDTLWLLCMLPGEARSDRVRQDSAQAPVRGQAHHQGALQARGGEERQQGCRAGCRCRQRAVSE